MASLRDELLDVRNRVGDLTPQIVVEEARPADSPLHSRFEWDDSVAGEAYRRDQAHRLIRSVHITYRNSRDEDVRVRAFVAVPQPDSRQPSFTPTEEVLIDPVVSAVVLAQMEREVRALRARYGHMAEFADLLRQTLDEVQAA